MWSSQNHYIPDTKTLFSGSRHYFIMFSYNPIHQVVVCHICLLYYSSTLRAKPHQLSGDILNTTVQLLSSYDLRTAQELKEQKTRLAAECQLIEYLASYDGLYCLQPECDCCTRHPQKIREHVSSVHKLKAANHKTARCGKSASFKRISLGRA